jgi:amino acid transporter
MTEVASTYLPWGATSFVTLGAIMAITTSLNPTLIVPSRLALIFVEDRLAPSWLGFVNPRTATPVRALTLTLAACLLLLVSKQLSLALNVAVFALILLYFLHSLVFLLLPRWNPKLNSEITIGLPVWLQRGAALLSVLAMATLLGVQILQDVRTLLAQSLSDRITNHSLTSLELVIVWSAVGAVLYALARRRSKVA